MLVTPWLAGRKMPTSLRDQFDRAITSILSNIAEGAGKTARADKRRSYEIAKGSTTEAAAQLELLHLREVISAAEYAKARHLLLRVASMLHVLSSGPRTA
ncbi:MAG: four helix bundle protein [Archangiaceae bacterium]|nr:four helix bundle protein [Archangiaceae bacterium]